MVCWMFDQMVTVVQVATIYQFVQFCSLFISFNIRPETISQYEKQMPKIVHQKFYSESIYALFDIDLTWLIVSFEYTELPWGWQDMIIDLAVSRPIFSLSFFCVWVVLFHLLMSLCCVNCVKLIRNRNTFPNSFGSHCITCNA